MIDASDPMVYHYMVMQEKHTTDLECNFDMFKRYLFEVVREQRPFGLHQLNVFLKAKVQKTFEEIGSFCPMWAQQGMGLAEPPTSISYECWERWWTNGTNHEKRFNWDGGAMM